MSNPMFKDSIYQEAVLSEGQMTIKGSIAKTAILLILALVSALYTWNLTLTGFTDKAAMFMYGGLIVGFISVLISSFNPKISNVFAPIYALAEGFALGGISAVYNSLYNGIVIQAVCATMVTLGVMLFLYGTQVLRATDKFRKIIITATISIAIFYLIVFITSFFHIQFLAPFTNAYNNVFVIGFITVIAAMNLILDFDFIERGSQGFLPSYFEWYGAMGLMVTLVWLYIEFLRLLSNLRRN